MISVPIISDLIKEVGSTVRELVPDADKRLELDVRLAELADQAAARETQLLQGQLEINKAEASHSNIFVAGWRPAMGWVGATALGWTWIIAPLLQWTTSLFGVETTIPALDPNAMYPVILAMLGISASRTVEKLNGAATSMGGVILKPRPTPTVQTEPLKTKVPEAIRKSRWF